MPKATQTQADIARDLLCASFLFAGLSEEEKAEAYRTAAPLQRSFCKGETVVDAGESLAALGMVVCGRVQVERTGGRRAVLLNVLEAGDLFGVSSLYGGTGESPTRLFAAKDTTLLLIPRERVEEVLLTYPAVSCNYIRFLSGRIRFLNEKLDLLAGRDAEERVAAYLLKTAATDTAAPLPATAVASALGLGRASLYRALDAFTSRGWIETDARKIRITNAPALQNFLYNRKEN